MAISKLRLLRVKADMTQEELAQKSGVSRATVTRIESGNVGLMGASLGNLLKLTKTLGVEIKDLLPDEEK